MTAKTVTASTEKAIRELLSFYAETGADAPVGDAPVDRFADPLDSPPAAEPAASAPKRAAPAPPAAPGSAALQAPPRVLFARDLETRGAAAPPTPDVAIMAAREAARTAGNLEELRAILSTFEGCALRTTATQVCFARGNPQARVMFVGEAPGYEEDKAGQPFVGRSGQLLDRMLASIGLDEGSAYIANIVPWRPPGNRTPTPQESAICLPFILRQIELADPDVLVCLGGPSAQTLLNIRGGITKVRGRWYPFHTGTREIRALATFHPAFLLRSPLQKRLVWRDLQALKKALAQS